MTMTEFMEKQFSKENTSIYYHFNVLVNDHKYSRIHPLKQKQTYELVNYLLKMDSKNQIEKIIILGEVLTLGCIGSSTLELVLIVKDREYKKPRLHGFFGKNEILIYPRSLIQKGIISDRCIKRVRERGYVIYE